MKIQNLYELVNKNTAIDDMEHESLIMDMEDKYRIKFECEDNFDFGTISDFANRLRKMRDRTN